MIKVIEGAGTPAKQVILVVEDEPIIRFGLAMHLEENGFQVIEAESAADAIAVLQEPGCIVNLVFRDVRMPGELDGIGLSRWIFEYRPNIAVILASGELGKATAVQDLCGADMTNNQKKAEMLAKAKEAEEFAGRAPDAEQRESWLRIAAAYYQLAERHQDNEPATVLADASSLPTSQALRQS